MGNAVLWRVVVGRVGWLVVSGGWPGGMLVAGNQSLLAGWDGWPGAKLKGWEGRLGRRAGWIGGQLIFRVKNVLV